VGLVCWARMTPTKRKTEKKEGLVRVRVTDAQKRAFETAAAKEGMDLSTFARVAMIEKARRAGVDV
jgi:uncharacterized protein (DUF1778 family)